MNELRKKLVETALEWEQRFGNAPAITSALSELDAAMLVGCSADEYSRAMMGMTAVQRGYDFKFNGARYQVKGNRPSGKRGSAVTWVPKATNYEWDFLVWVLYNRTYEIQEAWLWDVETYMATFDSVRRLSPSHHRRGKNLFVRTTTNLSTMDLLQAQAVTPDSVQLNGPLTAPRTYGVYELCDHVGSTKRFRFGNHPIRMRELEGEFPKCALRYLFLTREPAVAMASILNGPTY